MTSDSGSEVEEGDEELLNVDCGSLSPHSPTVRCSSHSQLTSRSTTAPTAGASCSDDVSGPIDCRDHLNNHSRTSLYPNPNPNHTRNSAPFNPITPLLANSQYSERHPGIRHNFRSAAAMFDCQHGDRVSMTSSFTGT